MDNPVRLIVVGLICLLIGVVLPFLMVLRLIEPTFLLSFIAYGSSIGGLFLGIMGAFTYARLERDKRKDPWDDYH